MFPPELPSSPAVSKQTILSADLENLRTFVVEKISHLRDWEKLISMRYEEYARDKHEVRGAAMQLESSLKSLQIWTVFQESGCFVPVQAVSIGCHHYICRGNTDGQDDLFKKIFKSLSKFYVELRIRLEGGKITPLTRARVMVKLECCSA